MCVCARNFSANCRPLKSRLKRHLMPVIRTIARMITCAFSRNDMATRPSYVLRALQPFVVLLRKFSRPASPANVRRWWLLNVLCTLNDVDTIHSDDRPISKANCLCCLLIEGQWIVDSSKEQSVSLKSPVFKWNLEWMLMFEDRSTKTCDSECDSTNKQLWERVAVCDVR